MTTTIPNQKNEWIIQRCLQTWKTINGTPILEYEDWNGYCEKPMTRDEMIIALKECEEKWPYEFRGHRVTN